MYNRTPFPRFSSFNPRARTGRDMLYALAICLVDSFNPRARTGRDAKFYILSTIPTCFNPRARTGRDKIFWAGLYLKTVFQSTRPHGARLFCAMCGIIPTPVSIHAPARGATGQDCWTDQSDDSFNPRARTGRDYAARSRAAPHNAFQSTRPHGARLSDFLKGFNLKLFQSTRPHGARHAARSRAAPHNAFQSTRPHGARHRQQYRYI